MKYLIILILITSASYLFADEEPNYIKYKVWEKKMNNINSVYLHTDNKLIVSDVTNGGTTWWLNPDDGSFIDSIHHYQYISKVEFSPNNELMILSGGDYCGVYNYNTKELIYRAQTAPNIMFIDNENIMYFVGGVGLVKANIYTNEVTELWTDIPQSGLKQNPTAPAEIKGTSCFDRSGRYAMICFVSKNDISYLLDIQTGEIKKYFYEAQYPMFNPTKDEFIFVENGKVNLYDLNNFETSKKIFYGFDIIGARTVKFSRDGSCLLFGGFNDDFIGIGNLYENYKYLGFSILLQDFNIVTNSLYSGRNTLMKFNLTELLSVNNLSTLPINIFPNPSTNTFNYNIIINIVGIYNLKIINSIGQEIINTNLGNLNLGIFNSQVNVDNYNSGTYYMQITNGIDLFESQFIIEN